MKFVLLSTLYPNQKQPTRALYNQRLFEAIRDCGHEVEVIAPVPSFHGKKGLPPKAEILNGIQLEHPRFFYTPGLFIHHHWRFYQRAISQSIEKLIARSASEKLHIALGFAYPDAVAMAPVCQRYGLDYSVFVLGSDFRVRTRQSKYKHHVMECLRQSPKIFCPGEALKEDMCEAGLEESKITSFKNGVNQSIFSPEVQRAAKETTQTSILFVGNLVPVKAPERLLRAFAHLIESKSDTGLQLDIVGDGSERSKLEKLSRELGIEASVHLHGRLPPETVASMMRQAGCLCLCSRSEGMPNVVVEALASGCPVVATNVGEVPYLIDEKINGCIVNIKETSEEQITVNLTQKLNSCLSLAWDREQISQRMCSYTWEHAAHTIIDELVK